MGLDKHRKDNKFQEEGPYLLGDAAGPVVGDSGPGVGDSGDTSTYFNLASDVFKTGGAMIAEQQKKKEDAKSPVGKAVKNASDLRQKAGIARAEADGAAIRAQTETDPNGPLHKAAVQAANRATAAEAGQCANARRRWPSGSPHCNRLARMASSAVPETTPNCPRRDTARASGQPDTPAPIPP